MIEIGIVGRGANDTSDGQPATNLNHWCAGHPDGSGMRMGNRFLYTGAVVARGCASEGSAATRCSDSGRAWAGRKSCDVLWANADARRAKAADHARAETRVGSGNCQRESLTWNALCAMRRKIGWGGTWDADGDAWRRKMPEGDARTCRYWRLASRAGWPRRRGPSPARLQSTTPCLARSCRRRRPPRLSKATLGRASR
ncbi:hypothetical protein T492DRAFT_1040686 [Pavlovales sp. CCMP2436]|nr:hypothetical protein T492DRAFT_1040686 [Pavlovales sp. CCMP2436]